MLDVLVALHSVDVSAVPGLAALGKGEGYVGRQVRGWIRRLDGSRTDDTGDWSDVLGWIEEHQPADVAQVLIHNDYRFDNLVLDRGPDDPRVVAVLDWELSTLGDPIADFSYLMLNWHNPHDGRAGLEGLDLKELGIPTQDEAVERYVARTGYPVPPSPARAHPALER